MILTYPNIDAMKIFLKIKFICQIHKHLSCCSY